MDTATNPLEWRSPGPQKRGRKPIISDSILKALSDRPGDWAVIIEKTFNDKSKKRIVTQVGSLARVANVRHRNDGYEFASRQEEDSKIVLFGRFTGKV